MTDEEQGEGPDGPKAAPTPQLSDFYWIGTACALSVVVAGAIGYGLDAAFHVFPWLTFVGLAFGVVSAVLIVVSQVRKFL